MRLDLLKHQVAITLATAVALFVWAVAPVVSGSSAVAQTAEPTAPPSNTAPSAPPAPPDFTETVKRIYGQASSYAGLPGRDLNGQPLVTSPPMSTAAFDELVGSMGPEELNALHGYSPNGWAELSTSLDALTQQTPPSSVAARLGDVYAAAARVQPSAAPAATSGPSGADYVPPPPELYEDANCPVVFLGPDDGYAALFAFQQAHHIAAILANPFYVEKIGFAVAVVVFLAIAAALEIPALTMEMLINSGTFCSTNNQVAELEVLNRNMVRFNDTTIALLSLDQQIQTLEGEINQLLDTRTQTVASKLNTAQGSLDKALQHSIERALQGGQETAIASFQLPASLGGYLDSTPIGVKVIVTDAINALKRASQSMNPTAEKQFSLANAALDAGQFKQAFFYYQAAYQGLTK